MKLYFAGGERVLDLLYQYGVRNIGISARYKQYVDVEDLFRFDSVLVEGGADSLQKRRTRLYTRFKKRVIGEATYYSLLEKLDEEAQKQEKKTRAFYESLRGLGNVILGEFSYGTLTLRKGRLVEWKHLFGEQLEPVLSRYDYEGLSVFSENMALLGGLNYSVGSFVSRVTPIVEFLRPRRVHTLGIGRTYYLERNRWDSSSVISWLDGTRYGKTYFFDGHTLKQYRREDKKQRNRFKNYCKDWDIDFDAFLAEDHEAVTRWSIVQWVQYARMLERREAI